ncbi:MAG: hypothetical protein FWJ93_05680 [Micromonosporaceae bacterium]
MTGAIAAMCLVAAALVVGWPARSRRARQRRLGIAPPRQRRFGITACPRRFGAAALSLIAGHGWGAGTGTRSGFGHLLTGRAGWAVAALCAAIGLVLGGPVAATVAAAYGAVGCRALARRERRRVAQRARARMLDALGALAADLRAGLPPSPSGDPLLHVPAARPAPTVADQRDGTLPPDPLVARAAAAVSLAESTGAPLADLLERIEADGRASDRAAAVAGAQSAGAQATAWLLAGLPAAGIGLGYAIGADPLHVLLRTPLGGACALGAVTLQLAGLAWSARLTRSAVTW